MRVLAGVVDADEGELRFAKAGFKPPLFIGHANALNVDLTAIEALQFLAALHSVAAPSELAGMCRQSLKDWGVADAADAPVSTLSHGQRRRVALARLNASSQTPLWLLDEPYDALDLTRVRLLNAMVLMHLQAGGSVVLTSHQPVDIAWALQREVWLPTAPHGADDETSNLQTTSLKGFPSPPWALWDWRLWAMRDIRLAVRRRGETMLPLGFFAVAATLFPFGVGVDAAMLRAMAPGVIWVCVLLAMTLSVQAFFSSDAQDGTMEQLLLSRRPLAPIALARAMAHTCVVGLPLIVSAGLVGLMYGLPPKGVALMGLALLAGMPALSLLACLGSALIVGVRGGAMLLFLIVLPLMVPVLIFGAGASVAWDSGVSPRPFLSLLAAFSLGALGLAPWAIGAAMRLAVE